MAPILLMPDYLHIAPPTTNKIGAIGAMDAMVPVYFSMTPPFSTRYQLIQEETKNLFIYKILLCVIFI